MHEHKKLQHVGQQHQEEPPHRNKNKKINNVTKKATHA